MGSEMWAPITFRSYHKENSRELQEGDVFWAMGSGLLIHSGAITKKIPRSTINICSVASILVIASYAYIELPAGSSRRELRFWAMASVLLIPSGAITEIISRSTINICSVASILVLAPHVYIEFPVGRARRGLLFWAM